MSVSAALASVSLPGVSSPAVVVPAAPQPVATLALVFQSAVALSAAAGGGLSGAVLRPSLPARGAQPSGRWVLSVSFASRALAVAFAQRWSGQLGFFLRVLGSGGPSGAAGFSVSVPLLAPPAAPVSLSFVASGGSSAVAAFVRRLAGLSV